MTTSPRSLPDLGRPGSSPGGTRTASSWAGSARLAGWLMALAAVLVVLDTTGTALPALPDLGRPARLPGWVDQVGAVPAAFALLRVLALAVTWYLLATTVLGAVARLARSASLTRIADAATLPQLRRFLHRAVGAGTLAVALPVGAGLVPATSGLAPPVALAQPAPVVLPPDASPPTIRGIATVEPPSPAPDPSAVAATTPVPTDPPVVRAHPDPSTTSNPPEADSEGSPSILPPAESILPPGAAPSTPAPGAAAKGAAGDGAEAAAPRGAAAEGAVSPAVDPSPPEGSWRIEPGDHLWRVAASTLERRWARPPTDVETAAYLDRVIDANRTSLVAPDNPDLVFAGQVFVLPAVLGDRGG